MALGLVVVAAVLLTISPFFGVRFDVILSGSMSPSLNAGDLAVVGRADPATLQAGDVIVFVSPLGEGLVCHRIVEVIDGEESMFQTKGDGNEEADPFLVERDRVQGRVEASVPYIGYLVQWLRGPLGLLALFSLLALAFAIPNSKSSKDKDREKEDTDA